MEAERARDTASARPPPPAGIDSRTTVKPFWPGGQAASTPGLGAVVVAGGGLLGVDGGPDPDGVPAGTVGSATVAVGGAVVGRWAGPPWVATIGPFLAPASARTMAAVAPATAIRKPRRTGQTQSPGYQPNRRCQADDSRPKAPGARCKRWPHSRQYS